MADPCCVRLLWKTREQGRDIYSQTSRWCCPFIDADGLRKLRVEEHPEWDAEPLKSSENLEEVIERRPWP